MKLITKSFNKLRELEDFVNEAKIQKKDIVTISHFDGLYTLMYYGD